MTRVLLAGATGFIGQRVYEQLKQSPKQVSVLYTVGRRSVLKAAAAVQEAEFVGRFADLAQWMTGWQADVAVCALGTTIKQAGSQSAFRAVDYDAVLAFAQFAKRIGVQHFIVVSAIGAHPQSMSFYSRVKGEVEQALAGLGFEQLSIIQPSLLLGARAESRPMEKLGQMLSTPVGWLLQGPLSPYRPIHGDVVASAISALAIQPLQSGTRRYTFPVLRQLASS